MISIRHTYIASLTSFSNFKRLFALDSSRWAGKGLKIQRLPESATEGLVSPALQKRSKLARALSVLHSVVNTLLKKTRSLTIQNMPVLTDLFTIPQLLPGISSIATQSAAPVRNS